MLDFGASLDFKNDSNCFNPVKKLGFNFSFEFLRFSITSISLVGEGRAKASNPEKSFKMLSVAICRPSSSLVVFSDSLKT